MKRLIPVLLVLLLLCGCDLRNRQDSANFIPTGTDPAAEQAPTESTQLPPADTEQVLPGLGGGLIKEIYKASGQWPQDHPELGYFYRIPFIDLQGPYVDGCNREIDQRFRKAARDAMEAMDRYETPEVVSIDYTVGFFGTVVSLEITQTDAAGRPAFAIYNFDAETGEGVERDRLLRAAGFTAKELETLLPKAAEREFRRQFGSQERLSPVAFADALDKTLELDAQTVTVFLTSGGRLKALVPLCDLAGGQTLVPLEILPETAETP